MKSAFSTALPNQLNAIRAALRTAFEADTSVYDPATPATARNDIEDAYNRSMAAVSELTDLAAALSSLEHFATRANAVPAQFTVQTAIATAITQVLAAIGASWPSTAANGPDTDALNTAVQAVLTPLLADDGVE